MMKLRLQIALLLLTITCSVRCDLVPALVPGVQTNLGTLVVSVDWCGLCQFLAVGGNNGTTTGIVGVYQFDQTTGNLSLTGTPTTLGSLVNTVAWCPLCEFLAAGGLTADDQGIINIYSFNPTNPGPLDTVVGSTITPGITGEVYSIDWCPSCTVFAASFETDTAFGIQAYSFDPNNPGNPVPIGNPASSDAPVLSIKWCGDCQYLAAVNIAGTLTIYTLDPVLGLVFTTSATINGQYYAVDWCNSCSYIAAGGQNDSGFGIINIYNFDPQSTESLLLIATTEISPVPGLSVSSVAWCQGCDNLAASAENGPGQNAIVKLYHFDPITLLTSVQTQPLDFNLYPFFGKQINWCGNCCQLAVGGFEGTLSTPTAGVIQLFRSSACGLQAPANLRAQQTCHRFPTQVDIINTICWDAVTGAVAYKVYADAVLTILLATIPSPTLCYTQHQICQGKTVTYYVTTVDANGVQSLPAAVVTI